MTALKRLLLVLAGVALVFVAASSGARAQSGWSITSYNVIIAVSKDSTLSVTEDITVDFGSLASHGIFRYIPVEYEYDEDHNRATTISNVRVDDGATPRQFESSREGPNLVLKIGDPDVEVVGVNRYRIAYEVQGALNPQETFDELYWNVTGNDWEAQIQGVTASVLLPGDMIERIQCFEGPFGATAACESSTFHPNAATFGASNLPPGDGLTIDLRPPQKCAPSPATPPRRSTA